MPSFKTKPNTNIDTLNNKWTPVTKFDSNVKVVDEKHLKVGSNYKGRQHWVIDKKERAYSGLERFGRILLGTVAVICTLCLGLLSHSIRNLFTKPRANVRFATLKDQTQFYVEANKIIYLNPKLLFQGTHISKGQELNFALVKIAGEEKLVPVTTYPSGRKFTKYEGSAIEALLKIAQDKALTYSVGRHFGSPVRYFLNHTHNTLVSEEEFFKFLLEKDETGTPRIFTLNYLSTLEVLNIIKEKNIPINLNETNLAGETLLTIWAGKEYGKITKLILELDPNIIDQDDGQVKSSFVKAVLSGSKEEANFLIDAMLNKGIVLSQEELWIQKAFKNDCTFSEEEFTHLDQELKIKTFFTANISGNEDIVKKLKSLGMDSVPLFRRGPSILAYNMDIVTAKTAIVAFLKDLRKKGQLLTAEEFNKLDKNKYIDKADQIGRVLGKNFIEKTVKEHGLKHIKVPKKIVVINENLEDISFQLAINLEMIPKEHQLQIYAERVVPVSRKLSLEEAIEFMIILEKTGYNDFIGRHFFFCEDGIYFVDTEYNNFAPTRPQFKSIKSIKNHVDPKDVEKFLEEYNKRKEAFDKKRKLDEAQQKDGRAAVGNAYSMAITHHEFNLSVASFI